MGLLDCVASPEERDRFDETQRPYSRPRQLSRSDHDISRRRALPLFSSQASLKNIRDVDFWRTRVLRFIFSPEGREDVRVLKVPFKQLGYSSVTDFIAEIPSDLFSEFLVETPPDEGVLKEDKVFWVHDGIAEPGIFKWQGVIENVSIIGLQLDRKKAVPFGVHDGKGLYYCKPGHRALVPEQEVVPYKKFLRTFLGLPPRQDSLVGMRDSVRHSAKAIAAKNAKPGDKVYLPKEKTWATVQWIGKIEGETVVDLVYEPQKTEPGKPVSPDEPSMSRSRSMSLADFIGELASEPNTPLTTQPQEPQNNSGTTANPLPIKTTEPYLSNPVPPAVPSSPLPDSSNESYHSEDESFTETEHSESEENSDTDHSMASDSDVESDDGENPVNNTKELQVETPPTAIDPLNNNEDTVTETLENANSPQLASPKRKGFFGFTQNKRQKRRKSPPPALTIESKSEFASLPELKHSAPTPRSRNSNIFSSWRFGNKQRKAPALKRSEEVLTLNKQEEEKSPVPSSKKKSGLSSSWGALFKSKSKTQLQKTAREDTTSPTDCATPIDDMVPPDMIPTPPPLMQQPFQTVPGYNERRIDRPEYLNLPNSLNEQVAHPNDEYISDMEKTRGEVSLCPDDRSSESETSDTDEDEGQSETKLVTVEMHDSTHGNSIPLGTDDGGTTLGEIKITTLEKEIVQEVVAREEDNNDQSSTNDQATPPPSSLERFKESRVRNRPSSFGSFLARIKNTKPASADALQSPTEPTSPTPVAQVEEEKREPKPAKTSDTNESHGRKNSGFSDTSHSEIDGGSDENKARETSSTRPVMEIKRSLVKPKTGVASNPENEGNQEELVLEFLDVKEQTPPVNSPPPVPTTDPPKKRPSRNRSFTFAFPGKRKPSQLQTPTSPTPNQERQHDSGGGLDNNDNEENVDPQVRGLTKKQEEEDATSITQSITSSFRNSFRRTFSLTRNKKRPSFDSDQGGQTTPPTPTNRISKPRPVTVYIDNNEVQGGSFRKKRPTSLVVDIKPWNTRHGKSGGDIYSSPSSDEAPMTPSSKSPNPALLPKANEASSVPKHRMFTTPAFFYKKPTSKSDNEPLIRKTSTKSPNKKWTSKALNQSSSSNENSPANEQPPSAMQQTPQEIPAEGGAAAAKLKSALKQRKEIASIPKGLKVNDRVLWYSGKGPIPGTVLRLFKDGTDKYTAMVKFDREVQEEPLRLVREGDAYIVTVEELITPDMFEPTCTNLSEINQPSMEPETPVTPSVRFNGLSDADPVPEVVVTGDESPEADAYNLPPPFQEEEVTMACGFRRGIQCRDKSCCLETILFSLFYTTNVFDITMLYANSPNEDALTGQVRSILRREIVDPLRREGFCSWTAVKKLRDAYGRLGDEWQTLSTDAEVCMFVLFDCALKLQKFISYSNEMSDFLHQLVVDTKDFTKSTTVQHLFETSLQMMDKLKLKNIPTPALILEMPRSNDKLMQYKAVIPNLSLTISHILERGPRLCICGAVAKYDCTTCSANVGEMSIVYCDNCKSTADVIHFQLTHDVQLAPLNQPVVILDLTAIICVKGGHYFSFVKCGQETFSPWVFFDGAELENPKVCIEQNLSMWLDRLEKYPGRYQDALQYPLLTHILQDSHVCIYQPREKSSSV